MTVSVLTLKEGLTNSREQHPWQAGAADLLTAGAGDAGTLTLDMLLWARDKLQGTLGQKPIGR